MTSTQFYLKYNKGMQWFFGCETPDAARVRYRLLARKFHPDVNPGMPDATSIMQEINAHYERDMRGFSGQTFSQGAKSEKEYTYTYRQETENKIIDIIVATLALHMQGVKVELIGSWIWCSGNTKPYKDLLGKKGLGYKWSGNREMWYFTTSRRRRRASKASMDTIRARYGSRVMQDD